MHNIHLYTTHPSLLHLLIHILCLCFTNHSLGMSRPLKHVGRFLHSLCMDVHQQLSVFISTLKINSQFTGLTTNKLGQYYLRVPSKNQCLQLGCIQIKYTMMEGILLMLNMCPNSFMLHTRDIGSHEKKKTKANIVFHQPHA